MNGHRISILLPTSGPPDTLERTLQSLRECVMPSAYRETIVIENGPPMGAEAVTRKFRDIFPVRHLHFRPKGKSRALNYALRNVIREHDFVLFTDDDVRFNPLWIVKYQRTAEKYGPGHYFGGAFGVDYEEEPVSSIIPHLPPSARGLSDDYYTSENRIWFIGFNWAAFTKDLCDAGLFRPFLGPGSPQKALGQESEMQRRMSLMGLKPIFIPENPVWHYVPEKHLTPRWIFQRRTGSGVLASYLLKRRPLMLGLKMSVALYDLVGLLLFPISKQRFYWHYFRLAYRIGLIKGIFARFPDI